MIEEIKLPIIHNISEYGLKWKNTEDINFHINYHLINNFCKKLNNFNNIIFLLQTDSIFFNEKHLYCLNLKLYFDKLNIKIIIITGDETNKLIIELQTFNTDLIILFSNIKQNIKTFLSSKIYCFFNEINEYTENTIKNCDKIYINDKRYTNYLKNVYQQKSDVLYFYNIPFFKNKNEFTNNTRIYDYIIFFEDCINYIHILNTIINKFNKFKIIIVGKNNKFLYDYENITTYEKIESNKLEHLFIQTKNYIQLNNNKSYYKLFAQQYGCKIITLENDNNIYRNVCCVYGVPSILNEKLKPEFKVNDIFKYKITENLSVFQKIFHMDIYLNITYNLTKKISYDKINYIYIKNSFPYIYDIDDEDINVCIKTIYNNMDINIWILKDFNQLFHFNKSKIYILRGLYHNTYNKLCPTNSVKILYPATSLVFNFVKKNKNEPLSFDNLFLKPRPNRHKFSYDIVLKHEDKVYDIIYKDSTNVMFFKYANNNFKYLNKSRVYDMIFVSTAKQETKNHDLFISFLDYCELINFKIKVIYITNIKLIEEKLNITLRNRYTNIKLFLSDKLDVNKLIETYNKCKINISFAGRDACPRVIAESANCGCFNIALDTLTDGKFYYNDIFGKIIGFNDIELDILVKSKSLKYKPHEKLWNEIIKYVKIEHDHDLISKKFKLTYNEEKLTENIYPVLLSKINDKDVDINYNQKLFSNINILIVSTQNPYNGGSSTNAYKLISYLRKLGFKVCGIFFSNNYKISVDPDNIGGVFQIGLNSEFQLKKEILHKLNGCKYIYDYFGKYPDIILALNYGSPIIVNEIFPFIKKIYLVVGSPVLTLGENSYINKGISFQRALKDKLKLEKNEYEEVCIKLVEKIVPNNINLYESFIKVYGNVSNLIKPIDYAKNILEDNNLDFEIKSKPIDVIVIASNWERKVKNLDLVIEIYNNLPDLNKVIVGINKNLGIPNTTQYPRISYDKVQQLLLQSKIIINTSFFESGPNIVLEAFSNKCQVICSKNVGYRDLLEDYQLTEDVYDYNQYVEKINYILKNFSKLKTPVVKNKSDKIKFINFLLDNTKKPKKKNILFVSCDIPNIGGAATNTYNLINKLKDTFNCFGLFITNIKSNEIDPYNIGNISKINVNENLKQNITEFFKNNKIDIIFVKNYKIYVYIYKYIPSNIVKVFSPSGLRNVTNYISKNKKYIQNVNLNIFKHEDDELIEKENILEFVKINDKNLEYLVFRDCDYILPNSDLTYNIIKKQISYDKLFKPIYLTNIFLEDVNNLLPFVKRKYHLGFVAYNWKRACKNYDLVKKLINHIKIKNYNIVIVGLNQSKNENQNNDSFDNLDKPKLINLFKNCRTVVIPSFYDSNPNVLIEAIKYGCNVVTSTNVGNNNFINQQAIVQNPTDINEWITKISKSTRKLYPFIGYKNHIIKSQLISFFNKI